MLGLSQGIPHLGIYTHSAPAIVRDTWPKRTMAEAPALSLNQTRRLLTPLNVDRDLKLIINELAPVAHNWDVLGTCLPGLKYSEVKEIKKKQLEPKNALLSVIERWLATADRTVTWNDILDALREPILSENHLAEQIKEKICSQTIQKSLSSPSEVEQESAPKKCVRSESLPAAIVQSPCDGHSHSFTSQSECLVSPQESIASMTPIEEINPPVALNVPIQELSSVSQPSAVSQSRNASSTTDSTANVSDALSTRGEDTKSPYGCGCGECTMVDFATQCCPNPLPTVSKYPYLNTSSLTAKEKKDFEVRLNKDFREINKIYASFTASLRRSLKERGITPKELVDCLMDLSGYQPITNSSEEKGVGVFQDRYSEMEKCEDISAVFKILSADYCSFFNYDIVGFIVKNLGTENDEQNLKDYELAFKRYCKRHVFQCPHFSVRNRKFADLVLKVNENTAERFTVEALDQFSSDVTQVLNVTKHALTVRSIKQGCLEIVFQIPNHIYTLAFPLTVHQEEALRTLGVQNIEHRQGEELLQTLGSKVLAASPDSSSGGTHSQSPSAADSSCKPRGCIRYKLGQCHHGEKCRYRHSGISPHFEPVVDYVPVPSSTSSSTIRKFLGKLDLSPNGKGFIPLESDRASASQEIKLVAEDLPSLEFAKEHVKRKFSLPPGKDVQRTRECVKYKLLGKCVYDPCIYVHGDVVESPSIGYVSHPVGKIPNIRKVIGYIGRCKSGAGSYITALSDRNKDKEIKVIAENDAALYEAKKEVEVRFGQMHSMHTSVTAASIALCYVHPKGLFETSFQLKMQRCEGRRQHHYTVEYTTEAAVERLDAKTFQHLNKDLPRPIQYMLDHPEETTEMEAYYSYPSQVRLYDDYRDRIQRMLRDTLTWMYKRHVHPKLEGRFGKIRWAKIPAFLHRDSLEMEGFINFIFQNTSYQRFFRSQLAEADALQYIMTLMDLGSTVETYDLKFAVKNKGKIDIRLKFVDGTQEIMAVRKDEEKILISDILCFHRNHDMRLSLSSYGVVPHDDPTVQKILQHVKLLENGGLKFMPQSQDKEWTARIVRHKVRRAYLHHKKNYLVTMTTVKSYDVEAQDLSTLKETVLIVGNDWREHHELEVHNLTWEVNFATQFGMSPEQSLSLLLDPTKIPSDVLSSAPRQWTPDSVMDEFQADEFLQIMDDINKSIDHEVTVSA